MGGERGESAVEVGAALEGFEEGGGVDAEAVGVADIEVEVGAAFLDSGAAHEANFLAWFDDIIEAEGGVNGA